MIKTYSKVVILLALFELYLGSGEERWIKSSIEESNVVYPDTAIMKLFVFSKKKYSKSDAKSDLTSKLEFLNEKFNKYMSTVIAEVIWPTVPTSSYNCE